MKRYLFLLTLLVMLLTACGTVGSNLLPVQVQPTLFVPAIPTAPPPGTRTPTPFSPVTATPLKSATAIVLPPLTSDTPMPATAEPVWHPAGEVVVPIFLYHHISKEKPDNPYTTQVEDFRRQVTALKKLGYQTISLSLLVEALNKGANLPPRPVIITFDDGYRTVYDSAFPILKESGFQATVYLISNALDKKDYLTTAQCRAMLEEGWEFGSHTQSHLDLARNSNKETLFYEVTRSKMILEEKLGAKILTFAYPYGARDPLVEASVKYSGYIAGMGLGLRPKHQLKDLWFLNRIEIKSTTTFDQFTTYLPWK